MTISVEESNVLSSTELPPDPNMPYLEYPRSVLGPLLFTLYVNELADLQLTEGSKVVAYADDLLLYKPIESTTDFGRIQEDMHETPIRNWMSCNFLTPSAITC